MEKSNLRLVIDSLPRVGSTTMAEILNLFPGLECIVEPFHPHRCGGAYYRMAMEDKDLTQALRLLWLRWNVIKHVRTPHEGWPFPQIPHLNEDLLADATHVIFMRRRNRLQRYVSTIISQKLQYWIGEKNVFEARLDEAQLSALDPDVVRGELDKALANDQLRETFVRSLKHQQTMIIDYEDFLGPSLDFDEQQKLLQRIARFLGIRIPDDDVFNERLRTRLRRDLFKWNSPEVYDRIPSIRELERRLASEKYGSLFAN